MRIRRRDFLMLVGAAAARPRIFGAVDKIKIGVCVKSQHLEDAVHYGFDYLEPPVAEIAKMEDADFEAFKQRVLASPIRCESFNSFVRTLRVVGADVDQAALQAYAEQSLERCRQLGGKVVVWGSAGSRNVPPGFPREGAWKQMQSFLRLAGDVASTKGLVVAIEPLRRRESNIINTGAEALRLVREVNHPNVQMIIDYYHLREENEDPQIVWTARKHIVHYHFADPDGRVWPANTDDDSEYAEFFSLIKKTGFHGGISIEGRGTFEKNAASSLAFFHKELA